MLGIGMGEIAFLTALFFLVTTPQKLKELSAEKKEKQALLKTQMSYQAVCKKVGKKS